DKCHLYRDKKRLKNISISKTLSPYGNQAFIFKPKAIDILLGNVSMYNEKYIKMSPEFKNFSILLSNNISNGNLIAYSTNPNIFNFNIDYISNNDDYLKLDKCQSVIETNNKSYLVYWIVGIIVFLLIMALLVLFMIQKK